MKKLVPILAVAISIAFAAPAFAGPGVNDNEQSGLRKSRQGVA